MITGVPASTTEELETISSAAGHPQAHWTTLALELTDGMNRNPMLKEQSVRRQAVFSVLVSLGIPLVADAQAGQPPRLVKPDEVASTYIPRSMELERRFLDSKGWVFYHRIGDLPAPMREVLYEMASPSIVDTGKSFDAGDVLSYGTSHQHLFSAATSDLWVLVWYAGSFNGPTLHTLLYDPQAHDACEYDFGGPFGAISLEPELKALVRTPRVGARHQYYPPRTAQ